MTRENAIDVLMAQMLVLGKGFPKYREAMEMAIAALREKPRWISVEERLPGDELIGKDIIVCTKNRWNEQRVSTLHWWGLERTNNLLFWPDITHWMPLPEPPKEEVWER